MKQIKPMAALTLAITISSSAAIAGVVEVSPGEDKKTESSPAAAAPMSAQQVSQAITPDQQAGMSGMQGPLGGMSGMQGPLSGMSGMQGPQSGMQMMPGQQEQGGMPMMYGYPGGRHHGYNQYSGMPAPYAYQGGRPGMGPRGMRNRMMGQRQEAKQKHMQVMEAHLANIEKLLGKLVELEEAKKSSK